MGVPWVLREEMRLKVVRANAPALDCEAILGA